MTSPCSMSGLKPEVLSLPSVCKSMLADRFPAFQQSLFGHLTTHFSLLFSCSSFWKLSRWVISFMWAASSGLCTAWLFLLSSWWSSSSLLLLAACYLLLAALAFALVRVRVLVLVLVVLLLPFVLFVFSFLFCSSSPSWIYPASVPKHAKATERAQLPTRLVLYSICTRESPPKTISLKFWRLNFIEAAPQ